jgi:chloramphenicol 3-O-phosphotransferase
LKILWIQAMVDHGLNLLAQDSALTKDALVNALTALQALTARDLGKFIQAAQVVAADLPQIIADVKAEFGI